ncbi:unnamed protein product, partial [Nippostrongylus brasiliensis]|uniref:Peptidase A2 domain-containing protein n=1 Tax=Nippostrongylus brasiliensis TaxID=27835 RepID=A0A0N4XKD9_NIPBR
MFWAADVCNRRWMLARRTSGSRTTRFTDLRRRTPRPIHSSDRRFFVTQIPIRVNGICLLALVDTGAGITVASKSLLTLLGISELEPSLVPSAVGMAGIPVNFIGSAMVNMSIGSEEFEQQVHFTATQCVPTQASAYNLILGNDVLARVPRWSVDYNQRVFHMGNDAVQIYTCAASDVAPRPTQTASAHTELA